MQQIYRIPMWKYDFYSCFPTLLKSHLRMGALLKICCMVLEQPFCKKTSRGMLLSFSVLFLKICARASKIFVIKDFKQFDWVFSTKNSLKKKRNSFQLLWPSFFFFARKFLQKINWDYMRMLSRPINRSFLLCKKIVTTENRYWRI